MHERRRFMPAPNWTASLRLRTGNACFGAGAVFRRDAWTPSIQPRSQRLDSACFHAAVSTADRTASATARGVLARGHRTSRRMCRLRRTGLPSQPRCAEHSAQQAAVLRAAGAIGSVGRESGLQFKHAGLGRIDALGDQCLRRVLQRRRLWLRRTIARPSRSHQVSPAPTPTLVSPLLNEPPSDTLTRLNACLKPSATAD